MTSVRGMILNSRAGYVEYHSGAESPEWHPPADPNVPVFIEARNSGMYVHSRFFDDIGRVQISTSPHSFSIHLPWTALIYHDLHKVILAPHDSKVLGIHDKASEMRHQFIMAGLGYRAG